MTAIARRLRTLPLRHTVLRRLVTIPLVVVLMAVALGVVPIACAITGPFALRAGGRGRVVRSGLFLIVYLGAETVGLCWLALIWLRSGPVMTKSGARRQRYQESNYAVLARLLGVLHAVSRRLFGLRILLPETIGEPDSGTPTVPSLPDGPLIMLSRHGGPGDSFLLIHALLVHAHRRPRIVLKDTLLLDPFIDVVLGRVPHCFIDPNPKAGADVAGAVGLLASGMGPGDVLVIFPEGGNFTSGRRVRAIEALHRRGLRTSAKRAQRLPHVLPPRPAGVFAAVAAAPGADVVFVAHTGLAHMEAIADVWRCLPLTEPVRATWWTVPASRVPIEDDARVRWLQDNWAEVDAWIDRQRAVEP